MANNIIPLDPNNFSSEVYSPSDESLITSNIEQNQFDINTDYVEYFVFDLNNNKIAPSGADGTFSNYSLLDNEIYIDPTQDLSDIGIDTGAVNVLYSFYRKWVSSSPQSTYYIKEISSNRTEIRLDSNIIDRVDIISSTNEFISYREEDETFPDFYLNLGSNLLFIANNIQLDEDGTILIKLYEPLPSNIQLKTSLWIVEKISDGLAYRIEFEDTQEITPQFNYISGPNLNLSIKDELNNSSEEINLSNFSSPNSQSEYQINSFFEDPSIQINVDYTDFSNFVHFSSVRARLENFWDKITLIESSSNQLLDLDGLTDTVAISSSKATLNSIINDTITNFDSYEYFLYFETSSVAYPKTNSTPPYQNASTGSAVAIAWSESMFQSASDYDRENQDWLKYSIPEYLRDDSSNDQYLTFINMIGHFVDNNIWLYLKDTTNKWDADNRINAGVSKDLVAQILRDLGVKIYQNNYSSGDLYSSFLGFTDSGSLFPFPNMTGSLPTPSGYEYISNFISSSDEAIPLDDINKRIYKRIYHNLPYLLKSKGTVEGLRTLINVYGIPDTVLRISEFGGKDKINTNDWDLWKHQYNYKGNFEGESFISSSFVLNSLWPDSIAQRPSTIQFRFNAGEASTAIASQSLWALDNGTPSIAAVLEYDTNLPTTSGSYSGSIIDPEYQYATLKFTADSFQTSASVRLPFYNNDWWSVQINNNSDAEFELLVANKIYSGSDGSQIGYIASSSCIPISLPTNWKNSTISAFPSPRGGAIIINGNEYTPLQGKYQEIRYFSNVISESVFRDYVMNPQSTEGNGINGSYNQLAFRASLGGDLYTGSMSIHPKVSGSYVTSSFDGNISTFYNSGVTFDENKEWVFYDSPAVGIKNRNTDKIKRQDLVVPEGNTLSNIGSIQQKSYTTQDYTNNLNLLEVAFSPQNQINDDIISQIGFFNIGDYIGDPRLVSSSANTYPSLVDLSQQYFDKYSSNYDVYDYIRLIKFFDNSLFKMVKDFVPARTGIATGVVIKQHLLERQKYPTPQLTPTSTLAISHTTGSRTPYPSYLQIPETKKDLTITGSIGSTPALLDGTRYYEASTDFESNPIITVEGGAGGSVNDLNVPVGHFRAIDTSMPSTLINTSPKTLFKDGIIAMGGSASNGIVISPNGINDSTGKFTIDPNYTFKGDVNVEVRNVTTQRTFVLELVNDDSGGVVSSIQKVVPVTSGTTYTSLTLTDCIFEKGKTYYFRLKTTGGATNITGVTRVNFVQQGAPIVYRSGQFYDIEVDTPFGKQTKTISDSHEFYDGEYSGSDYVVTNGELNTECDIYKEADTTAITYDITHLTYNYYGQNDIPTSFQVPFSGPLSFLASAASTPSGDIIMWWDARRTTSNAGAITHTDVFTPKWISVSKTSSNGLALASSLENATTLKIQTTALSPTVRSYTGYSSLTGPTSTIDLNIGTVSEYSSYYLVEVTSTDNITLITSGYVVAPPYPVVIPVQSNTLINIDPFIVGNFAISDCNPLVNNATTDDRSVIYYDVDYSSNSITPVNFDAILAGTALKAELQDYNYFARRSIIPRYQGSRSTSNDFNLSTIEGGLGSLPNVEQDRAYFAYFNWVGGTTPEWGNGLEDRSALSIRYFVSENGDVIEPTNDNNGVNLGICRQTFTEGETGVLSFDDESGTSAGFSNLLGEQTIFKSGKKIIPIIYSQTESISDTTTGGYTGSITFVQGDQAESSVDDYRLTTYANFQYFTSTGTVTFTTPTVLGSEASFSSNVYAPTSSPSGTSPQTTITLTAEINTTITSNNGSSLTLQIQRNRNGAGWVGVGNVGVIEPGVTQTASLTFTDTTALSTDDYRVQAIAYNPPSFGPGIGIATTSFFKVTQTPPPSIGPVGPDAPSPSGTNYWTKLGTTTNQFRTNALTAVIGQKQQDIEDSGFSAITTDFNLEVGDEIRFQGTETQTYKITAIEVATNPSYVGALVYTVDRNITLTNTEMNWFLVRRYIDTPGQIIIEADKPAGGTSPGFFMPLYSTKGIEDNFDKIIQDLKTDQLI